MPHLRTDDLVIPQGTTWEVQWPIQNADGTPADLTGWSARAQVRKALGSSTVLYSWSLLAGNVTVAGGSVSLRVAPEVSSSWEWYSGVYDVELYHPDGRVNRITQGRVTLDKEVTR